MDATKTRIRGSSGTRLTASERESTISRRLAESDIVLFMIHREFFCQRRECLDSVPNSTPGTLSFSPGRYFIECHVEVIRAATPPPFLAASSRIVIAFLDHGNRVLYSFFRYFYPAFVRFRIEFRLKIIAAVRRGFDEDSKKRV